LPSAIDIDITDLRIGQSIRIDELTKTGDFEFLHDDGAVVCGIKMARGAMDEEEEDEEGEEGEEGDAEGEEKAEGGNEGGED
jgi:large subunit ribosomal protein L25